jgi:hypothetical protein
MGPLLKYSDETPVSTRLGGREKGAVNFGSDNLILNRITTFTRFTYNSDLYYNMIVMSEHMIDLYL